MLAHLAFGAGPTDAITHPGLQPLGVDSALETWCAAGPAHSGQHGPVAWRANAQLLFGAASVNLDGDVEFITQGLYQSVFDCMQACGFAQLLRVWHFLPRINTGAGDAERYKRFCAGRARAFDAHPGPTGQLPAGTAIGTLTGDELLIYFIAARTPARQIENPRQVSAFAYPRQYGPRHPMFSRAVVWPHDAPSRLIVSGTASIVGHESRCIDDLAGQLDETWRNLESLREQAGATRPLALRVYVRRPEDYPDIRAFLAARLAHDVAVIYLHADICRAELLVEIEGVYAMPPRSR